MISLLLWLFVGVTNGHGWIGEGVECNSEFCCRLGFVTVPLHFVFALLCLPGLNFVLFIVMSLL